MLDPFFRSISRGVHDVSLPGGGGEEARVESIGSAPLEALIMQWPSLFGSAEDECARTPRTKKRVGAARATMRVMGPVDLGVDSKKKKPFYGIPEHNGKTGPPPP